MISHFMCHISIQGGPKEGNTFNIIANMSSILLRTTFYFAIKIMPSLSILDKVFGLYGYFCEAISLPKFATAWSSKKKSISCLPIQSVLNV